MNPDFGAWTVLGRAIRGDRERQGLTREQLADRVRERGGQVTARSLGTLEKGPPPKRGVKRPSLEPTVAALGWLPGWTDRILAGEDPETVLRHGTQDVPHQASPRARLLELVPSVYEFSRVAEESGVDSGLRDRFEFLVRQMLQSLSGEPSSYALAAYRPHAEGEGVPADDAMRIQEAMRRTG